MVILCKKKLDLASVLFVFVSVLCILLNGGEGGGGFYFLFYGTVCDMACQAGPPERGIVT